MKKRLMPLKGLLPLAIGLFSCSSVPNPIGLEKGDGDYDIDGSVSNVGGSAYYEIFVRSFADSDGDGIGDFSGISAKADYLQQLGVSNVWLMPIHPSGSYHGYDVDDYYAVNPDYGTMEQFTAMVKNLNDHGIEVIIDMVLNHSSPDNPLFLEALEDYKKNDQSADSKADWYMFSRSGGSNYHSYDGVYCLGMFSPDMPEFNWDSAGFREEVKNILEFWIDKGVSGFRFDAVRHFCEQNADDNIEALNYIASVCRAKDPDCYLIGENWTNNDADFMSYFESGFDSFFCFGGSADYKGNSSVIRAAKGLVSGSNYAARAASIVSGIKSNNPDAAPSFFIANHDMDRSSTSLTGDYAKNGANLIYLLPGTPYIYYGEEIELVGYRGNEETDSMRRLPMVWGKGHNDEECDYPEPAYADLADSLGQVKKGAYDQLKSDFSLLNHYRKLLQVRNSIPFIKDATMEAITVTESNFCVYRLLGEAEDENLVVAINLGEESAECYLSGKIGDQIVEEVDGSNLKGRLQNGVLGLGPCSLAVIEGK